MFSSYTISPPPGWAKKRKGKDGFQYMRRKAYQLLKDAGIGDAFVLYHRYRIKAYYKKEFKAALERHDKDAISGIWEWLRIKGLRENASYYSPHFHVISTGWSIPSDEFNAKTGWVLKKHDLKDRYAGQDGEPVYSVDINDVDGYMRLFKLVRYLHTHHTILLKKDGTQALRTSGFVGKMRDVRIDVNEVYDSVKNKTVLKKIIARRSAVSQCYQCAKELRAVTDYESSIDDMHEICRAIREISEEPSTDVLRMVRYRNSKNNRTVWVPFSPAEFDENREMKLQIIKWNSKPLFLDYWAKKSR